MPDCPTCGKHCGSGQGLAAHLRSHDQRTVPCPLEGCGAQLRAASGLRHHLTSTHGQAPAVAPTAERLERQQARRSDRERREREKRREREQRAAERARATVEARKAAEWRRAKLNATLQRLVPALAPVYLERLLKFALKHAPERDTFAIIGPDFGPVMAKRVMVGQVVQKADGACIVVDLDVLREAQEAAEVAARFPS